MIVYFVCMFGVEKSSISSFSFLLPIRDSFFFK